MERAPTRLRSALTDRRRQCPGFGGKSMAARRGPVATAGCAGAVPRTAIDCQRARLGQRPMAFSPLAQRRGKTPRRPVGAETSKARRPRNPPAPSPRSRAPGRKPRGSDRRDRLVKGRHRHSAIVVRSRRYRNARDGLLEDGAHVRYSEDFGSERLRPRIPR